MPILICTAKLLSLNTNILARHDGDALPRLGVLLHAYYRAFNSISMLGL